MESLSGAVASDGAHLGELRSIRGPYPSGHYRTTKWPIVWGIRGMEDNKFDAIVRYLSGEQASHGLAHLKRDSEQYVLPEIPDSTDGMCLISRRNGMKVYPRSVSKIII